MKNQGIKWRQSAAHDSATVLQRGFTLVELLLVLVILALIGGLVLPGIIGKAEGAKVKAAASQVSRLAMAVESHYLDTGVTPESLQQLVEDSGASGGWNGPYVKPSSLKDPWGRDYEYVFPGEHGEFDIFSLGADGQPGGDGKDADINSWE
ncbi:MAG TPA: type II secretion system major pseudopilin GspG [Xanthomonadales bacterium]|nr:type II secretion system major pseudopilin GspG [Xanthomonadales bacterium]